MYSWTRTTDLPLRFKRGVAVWWLGFLSVTSGTLIAAGFVLHRANTPSIRGILPGEFEQQEALVFAWTTRSSRMIVETAKAIHQDIEIVVLVSDPARSSARQKLLDAGVPDDRFRIFEAPISSVWVRDYGPLQIKGRGGEFEIVDTNYGVSGSDPNHDAVPAYVAERLRLPIVQSKLIIENGNLLSNGAGLCVTTTKSSKVNSNRSFVSRRAREFFGATEVVFLERLDGELTGHVDMFATFTAPDTIVVGEFSPKIDPVNAAILDRNAERLASVQTACGPLRVHRVPMPERKFGLWMTHTNVVYANGTLLFPTFADWDLDTRAQAKAIFQELMPQWRIVEIDCRDIIRKGGALHCATMNLYRAPHPVGARHEYGFDTQQALDTRTLRSP